MPDARTLNWLEVTGILGRLGFNEIHRIGSYAVYCNSEGQPPIAIVIDQWDIPFDDLARDLSAIGVSRIEIEAALESLYSDH